jgi:hypothetical protein
MLRSGRICGAALWQLGNPSRFSAQLFTATALKSNVSAVQLTTFSKREPSRVCVVGCSSLDLPLACPTAPRGGPGGGKKGAWGKPRGNPGVRGRVPPWCPPHEPKARLLLPNWFNSNCCAAEPFLTSASGSPWGGGEVRNGGAARPGGTRSRYLRLCPAVENQGRTTATRPVGALSGSCAASVRGLCYPSLAWMGRNLPTGRTVVSIAPAEPVGGSLSPRQRLLRRVNTLLWR